MEVQVNKARKTASSARDPRKPRPKGSGGNQMDERETIGPRLSEARKIRVPSEKKKKKNVSCVSFSEIKFVKEGGGF